MRLVLLAIVLYAFWLLMSGNYQLWLVLSGFLMSLGVVWFSMRTGVSDREGLPFEKLGRIFVYLPWLAWQVVLSAINVSRIILDPRLPISPSMVKVEAHQQSAVGLTIYANSITLTPGTLSVEASERERTIWVHAITRENAAGFAEDAMNDKVAWLDRASGGETTS
ncbi:MAG: Na+/H+ antiporter subunit E [Paracoccaceae bacterium]